MFLLFIHPIVIPYPFLYDWFFHWNRDKVCFTQSSHYMQKECILASLLYCFWCFTWGTHSVWAHHTTGWWNGVWWVVMPVRQLRVTASACWKREVLLVLYMSGKCAYRTKDTCICVCKVLNSVCCFGGMWKVMFSNLQHISWIIVVVLWVVVPCTLLHLYSSSSFSFHLFPVFPCLFISSSYLFHLYLIALYLWYCSSGG